MIEVKVRSWRVTKACTALGIAAPFVVVSDETFIENGNAVFGRAFSEGVVTIYRGSLDVAYKGSFAKAPPIVTEEALLEQYSKKASHILLHELYHCKQFADGDHLTLSTEEIEEAASAFAHSNETQWDDLVELRAETG